LTRYPYSRQKPRRDLRFPLAAAGLLAALVLAGIVVGPQAIAALGGAAATPTPTPTPTATPRPTPPPLAACVQGDVPATRTSYDDWASTLLDTSFRLDAAYVPPDLVPVSEAGVSGSGSVRSFVIDDLRAMADAARADGLTPKVNSAYRSFDEQGALYDETLRQYGLEWAQSSAAQAGHSEHQLGTAIDFGGAMGAWLTAHSWQYGFINSFPTDSSPARTCYKPETWHVRYFGRATAAAIHESGLPAREWLWFNA
jgi:D-alanyl-D-alanine carboxypeptidase